MYLDVILIIEINQMDFILFILRKLLFKTIKYSGSVVLQDGMLKTTLKMILRTYINLMVYFFVDKV